MRPDRQLWRLMAAMIAMIIVYAAPSAVQAHEGHAHRVSSHAVSEQAHAVPPVAVKAIEDRQPASVPSNDQRLTGQGIGNLKASAVEPVVSPPIVDNGAKSCPGGGSGSCCGKKGCCVSGILLGLVGLPAMPFLHVVVIPGDTTGNLGAGPGALPEPPRTLA